jgi:alpha-D-ribose 1-methylphosphonate 5-triphosphate diphosphatase
MRNRLTNARIVTPDAVIEGGILLDGPVIAAIEPDAKAGDIDLEGDVLIPGIIDLHTDNLEKHFFPRPNIDWNPVSAAVVHDGLCASVGVTTVFDSLSIGSFGNAAARTGDNLLRLVDGLATAEAAGALRISHRLHWRCELPADDLMGELEHLGQHRLTGLFSLMDHTPGQRQYMHLERFLDRVWRAEGMSREDIDARMAMQRDRQARNVDRHRAAVAELARTRGVALAAHDDETEQHVDLAHAAGARIAEFPVTEAAAQRAHALGHAVIMGGPNLIRGGSYSGNLSAARAGEIGVLDGFASDYVPRSLVECAFALTRADFGWSLPAAVRTVTQVPAEAVGLNDRGALVPGRRADLVRIRMAAGLPVVAGVWVAGARVA